MQTKTRVLIALLALLGTILMPTASAERVPSVPDAVFTIQKSLGSGPKEAWCNLDCVGWAFTAASEMIDFAKQQCWIGSNSNPDCQPPPAPVPKPINGPPGGPGGTGGKGGVGGLGCSGGLVVTLGGCKCGLGGGGGSGGTGGDGGSGSNGGDPGAGGDGGAAGQAGLPGCSNTANTANSSAEA